MMRTCIGIVFVAVIAFSSCGGGNQTIPSASISVGLSPTTITMDQGAKQQFSATVSGSSNTAVVWSVLEGSRGGTIDAQGTYTAPAAAGLFHVVATSVADSNKKDTAQISINSVAVQVSPTYGDMEPGGTQQFVASITGSVNHNVLWNVIESTGGSITSDGTYSAPAMTGSFHVLATSAADNTQTARVTITVATLAVSISPRAVGLSPGNARLFSASVSGCMDDGVSWAVQEGSTGGVITSTGLYTAPMQSGQYHVIATSVAHPSVSNLATILVTNSSFSSAGNMLHARSNHTATLLPNGDVLLAGGGWAGGNFWGNITDTAEVYDHVTGSFRATGSLNTAREGHTATLLPNGKVLVAGGGFLWWGSTNSAELYDPATGLFTPTSSMTIDRISHTATLLTNGKVLFVGGDCTSASDTATAELYDPATGTFSATGRMSQTRSSHTATLLSDGRVLVAGGFAGNTLHQDPPSTDTAEIYNPDTGVFTSAASLVGVRVSHTATLLVSGRVLLAGGRQYAGTDLSSFTTLDDAQVFDPALNQFSTLASMNNVRSSHTATLLSNNQVLFAGGYGADNTAELFDPGTAIFLITGSMVTARSGHTATLLNDGRVLVAGGAADQSAELYAQH